MAKKKVSKVVLAYSGGLDTSCIVPWLIENYKCEVVTFTADLGQEEELAGLPEKAKISGAVKSYVEDLRQEFVTDFVFPTMKAGAIYERQYLLGTSHARPLISKRMVEIAEMEGADAIAHGATGKGNDQVRFELGVMALNPRLKVIAPWREWDIRSREDALAYATAHGVPVTATGKSKYSRDRNIWHLSHEGHILENPWLEPEEDMFLLTVAPEKAPDTPRYVEIDFKSGIPVRVDGVAHGPVELVSHLNKIGGEHGVGRVDIVENRLVGIKSRGVYETPGGEILYTALARAGDALPRWRHDALQGRRRREVRGDGLQRQVVHPAAHGDGSVRRQPDGERLRHGAAEAVQGDVHRRRAQVAVLALPRGLRHFRRGRRLRPERCRGLHPSLRPAAQGEGAARHRGAGQVAYAQPDFTAFKRD